MIPKIIHFITGLGTDDFGLIEYVAVASAQKHHPDWRIYVWHGDHVGGDWWAKLDELHVHKMPVQTPTHFRGKEVPHHAHRADLLRLPILYAHGGLYLDTDTITLRSMNDIGYKGEHEFHISVEKDSENRWIGLCNAVMMASPLSRFVARWLREYENFDPSRWGDMSVIKPLELWVKDATGCTPFWSKDISPIQPFEYEIFWRKGNLDVPFNGFIYHLWRTFSKPYMDKMTIESCAKRKTAYEYHAAEVLGL